MKIEKFLPAGRQVKLKIIFASIFLLAAFFRLYGLNWDQNQHLHPDERFLTMVSTAIQWPDSLNEYFDSNTSPLNPHNRQFPFFVYGTFPIFFTKYFAEIFNLGDYNNLTLTGRLLSALIDLGTVILVFLIAKEASKKLPTTNYQLSTIFPLLAMIFYAASVLPIQLSHFYAVDTYLTFFITLSFYLLTKIFSQKEKLLTIHYSLLTIFLGLSFGLALASKISAVLFLPIIELVFLILLFKNKNIRLFLILNSLFLILSYFTLRLAQPYLFTNPNILDIIPNPKVLENWKMLKSFDDPNGWFPPAVQWITTKPYIFPLKNLIFWGLGLPLGIISLLAIAYFVVTLLYWIIVSLKKKSFLIHNSSFIILNLSLLWILILFTYQGFQFAKPMRYFYPIYPFIAMLSAWFVIHTIQFLQTKFKLKPFIVTLSHCIIVALILIYPLSFISIYSRPHSRIQASTWIYENIPSGATIANEHWDDPLPLYLPNKNPQAYEGTMLPLYDTDTEEKWTKLSKELERVDYIVLSSNRLYGSILTVPEKYPLTSKYYKSLFDGSLSFEKIAEFTSRPNLPIPGINICLTPPFIRYGVIALKNQECSIPGISFVDDYADESFTVYDHPKVIIFKKQKLNNEKY
ncbi:phospholipid carrier-dependent glycosyltransferase [Candidatus Gottesmanbacteria bacterium]|nr:phospholipid carrier-dependent glycosyltransferase [Candidatus Gottesmanbacteria bacterium]